MASSYGGRRGPNVSQYLRELNTIQPEDSTLEDNLRMEADLALFTNSQFYDFESGQNTDFQLLPADEDGEITSPEKLGSSPIADLPLDFIQDLGFDFASSYQAAGLPSFSDGMSLQSLQGNSATYGTPISQQRSQFVQSPTTIGEKRNPESAAKPTQPLSLEEASRAAAENDKRRRNTAASARFRHKKKLREQALEKSAKEMSEKVTILEGRIQQLETENKWLKNMILEKNGGNDQIAALLEKGLGSRDVDDEIKDDLGDIEALKPAEIAA